MLKHIRYMAEAALLFLLYPFFRIIGMRASSCILGAIAAVIGPFMVVSRTAMINLDIVFPSKTRAEKKRILRKMYNHFGRFCGEFITFNSLDIKDLENIISVNGLEHIEKAKKEGKGYILFSAHIGNWEIFMKYLQLSGYNVGAIYRKANNPYVDRLVKHIRSNASDDLFAKGDRAAIKMLRKIRAGEGVAILVDQKSGDLHIPFFDKNARISDAVAKMAIKTGCPLIPIYSTRTSGVNFHFETMPPIEIKSDTTPDQIMRNVNKIMEEWIRNCPEQWLWPYKRWERDVYK